MSEAKDKRLLPREPVHLVTEIELDGQQVGCGVSRDASGGGLLLLTHLNLAQGSELALNLYVPPEPGARRLKASVVRCERILPVERIVWDYRVAVAFHDPPADLQELVRSLTKGASTVPPRL
jgi:PilZ domain-containing protein